MSISITEFNKKEMGEKGIAWGMAMHSYVSVIFSWFLGLLHL